MFKTSLKKLQDGAIYIVILGVCGLLFVFQADIVPFLTGLFSPSQEVTIASQNNRTVTMRSVLARDAIPAIDDPQFINVFQANTQYKADELVIGVEINGEARAYSVPYLSRHEIVNDTVGGTPIAVTW